MSSPKQMNATHPDSALKGHASNILNVKASGRKSSLASSLQNFATRTFHALPRRRNEKDNDDAMEAPKLQYSSTKFHAPRSPSKLPVRRRRPTISTNALRFPSPTEIPPVPPLPEWASKSRIPTLTRISNPAQSGGRLGRMYIGISASPDINPAEITNRIGDTESIVAYQDAKVFLSSTSADSQNKNEEMESSKWKEEENTKKQEIIGCGHRDSQTWRKRMLSFSGKQTPAMTAACTMQATFTGTGFSKSTFMAAPTPSCVLNMRESSSLTSSVSVPGGLQMMPSGAIQPRLGPSKSSCTVSRGASVKDNSHIKRNLPLPPIPVIPKSYSIGNIRLNNRPGKSQTRLSTHASVYPKSPTQAQVKRGSTISHVLSTPTKNIGTRRELGTAQNCYATAPCSSGHLNVAEALIDLIPPRKAEQSQHETRVSVSPATTVFREHQVQEAQPEQYWLGRISTLLNSFKYEEAFNESDPFLAVRAPSRTRLLKTWGIESMDEFHAKGAFAALEKACLTSEALNSFYFFKEAYQCKLMKPKFRAVGKKNTKQGGVDGRQTALWVGANTDQRANEERAETNEIC
ncbi:hypothetical protein LOZ51_005805 [Ophidiomyces ophidiicola]|nr:hypothetical protein LOZ55_003102 [Ophidiomyces ophidiicola]KAI1987034.1 hypothetical protein LOZ51_005805 [Ophidiomyces ophidiicola]KAI1989022.1 hypothetical protein LOZ54_003027 [Ophidiomyces ophidiicola]